MYSTKLRRQRWSFHRYYHPFICSLLIFLLINEMIIDSLQQFDGYPNNNNDDDNDAIRQQNEQFQFNYQQGDQHHIVKRKLKMKSIFGGKSKSKPKPRPSSSSNPYPRQPSHNPNYPGSASGSNPYPKQPAYNPNYPGSSSGHPVGPPPPYPGLNTGRGGGAAGYPQQSASNYPRYPQQSAQNPSYPGCKFLCFLIYFILLTPFSLSALKKDQNRPFGAGNTFGNNHYGGGGFGGSGFGTGGGYRKGKGLNIGRSIGTAGFGALAGTALGAYGGYKLGRMVGNLGRMGHYGYYNDQGRYMRCEPPRNIKIDPETNISYIPLDDAYDRRCSYFDRPPPQMIEPSMLISAANHLNITPLSIIFILTIFIQIFTSNRR